MLYRVQQYKPVNRDNLGTDPTSIIEKQGDPIAVEASSHKEAASKICGPVVETIGLDFVCQTEDVATDEPPKRFKRDPSKD